MPFSKLDNLLEVRPSQFVGVPRIWEKIREKLEDEFSKLSAGKQALLAWARAAASEHHEGVQAGTITKPGIKYLLAQRLVLSKIKGKLGMDRCSSGTQQCYSGAAPLTATTKRFFQSMDMVLHEVYGSSEVTGSHAINRPGMQHKAHHESDGLFQLILTRSFLLSPF